MRWARETSVTSGNSGRMNFTHSTGHQVETDDTIRLSSPEPVPLRALATVQEGPEKPGNDRPPPPTLPPGTPSVDLYFAVPIPFLIVFVFLLFKTCLLVDPKCCVPLNLIDVICWLYSSQPRPPAIHRPLPPQGVQPPWVSPRTAGTAVSPRMAVSPRTAVSPRMAVPSPRTASPR